ncbi:glycosyltransferase family 4 protein [Sinorhizobium meliloti]|uniref:glycosyltransferase family 4 protein n=1 Tax=Rhizobium meliloti TaxID=382 RepID=UPI002090E614|nr:glycosyltransferase family 4 protein [Sinorhizobium meliloti]MCO5965389.1 glycosyltransferase family 4 protein [Sinorhizobium meliloti]
MKHVLMIGPYPMPGHPINGGVERVVDTLARALSKSLKVTLVVPGSPSDLRCDTGDFQVVYLKRSPLPASLAYWSVDALRLRRIVNELRPDIVHIQGAAGYGLCLGGPMVLTAHGIPHLDSAYLRAGRFAWFASLRARLIAAVERLGRLRAGNVVVINDYVTGALPDVRSLRHRLIPNPLDRKSLEVPVTNERPAAIRLLAVGKVCRRKNTLGVLQLFAAAAKRLPQATLSLCGATPEADYLEECRRFVEDNGLSARVRFLGALSTGQLIAEYDRSSLLVLLSNQETAPMVICEAQARGLPVAAAPAFGIGTMVTHLANGFHLTGTDLEANAELLVQAANHRFDGAAIRSQARADYDPITVAAKTVAFYREVLHA